MRSEKTLALRAALETRQSLGRLRLLARLGGCPAGRIALHLAAIAATHRLDRLGWHAEGIARELGLVG